MSSQTPTAIEKPPIFQNGKAQNEFARAPAAPPSSEIDKLVIANTTLAVWLIFLAIGGGILALYYARIGYLPEVEWKASLIYLFIGSIVGGGIGLLLTLSLLIPGVVWSQFILRDPCIDFSLHSPVTGKYAEDEPCVRTVIRFLGLPFLLVLLVSHLFLLTGKEAYWILAALALAATFWRMRTTFNEMVKKTCGGDTAAHAFKYAAWFTLSVFLSQVTMYVIYWLSGSPGARFWQDAKETPHLGVFAILTLLCTAGVWLSNHAVVVLHRQHPRGAILAALLAAGLLLFTADHFSKLSVKLMNHYGLGYEERFNVLLTNHGEEIINTLGVPKYGTQLCNVEILSKIGDQYYLRVGDTDYVTLPKADVVAIRRLNK